MKRFISIILVVVFVLCLSSCDLTDVEPETSSITSMEFSFMDSPLSLEAGKSEKGYFNVKTTDEFSIDEIEFVSSDPEVAEFVYDDTKLKTFIYDRKTYAFLRNKLCR